MPRHVSKDKIDSVASEYLTNGFNEIEAMVSCGYSRVYARNQHKKLFGDNSELRCVIEQKRAKLAAKTEYTVEQARQEYQQALDLALRINQPAAAVSAITGKCRLYGYDKDNDISKDQDAKPIPKERLQVLREQAKLLDNPNIKLKTG